MTPELPIATTLSPSCALKWLGVAVLCLVFGVWGIWDYAKAIPAKQRLYDRFEVLTAAKSALESTNPTAGHMTDEALKADDAINTEWKRVTGTAIQDTPAPNLSDMLQHHAQKEWLGMLIVLKGLLPTMRVPPLDDPAELAAGKALEGVNTELGKIGTPSPPSAFDRATQWVFIASLPFAPYYFWALMVARRHRYRLDEAESLHFEGDSKLGSGVWPKDEIADIDMNRWMAKSIAWAVHTDGRRLKLDAYLHKNLEFIIGRIAARLHPNDWDLDARPRKADAAAEGTDASAGDAGATSPAAAETGVGA
jgi:hypothetical protein